MTARWWPARSTSSSVASPIVLQRTLRRQAQEFLDRPFTQRRCRLYDYRMSDEERSLYDDVTEYLMRPTLYAFAGAQRRLLLIGFHRRMASSIAALAASLENVASRLRRVVRGRPGGRRGRRAAAISRTRSERSTSRRQCAADADAGADTDPDAERAGPLSELALVDSFVARARALPNDAKARAFQDAIRLVIEPRARRPRQRQGRRLHRVDHHAGVPARRCCSTSGWPRTTSRCSGATTSHERARQAHARWLEEVGTHLPPGSRPTRDVAVRLALVHEFKTRSKILVCTEAGAKGLNLQFCETVINYDLPWNPQRIEQRIGRCHRYGQSRDVTVVNFIGRDNEAQQLTFEILSQKLDLFGKVLDASDHVLHEPRTTSPELVASAMSVEFENDLQAIYSRSRSSDEVTREIAALRDKIGARRDDYEREYQRTSQIIHSRFDQDVRRVFKQLRDELPPVLVQIDRDIADVVDGYLKSRRGQVSAQGGGRPRHLRAGERLRPRCRLTMRRRATLCHRRCARPGGRAVAEPVASAGDGSDRARPRLEQRRGRVRADAAARRGRCELAALAGQTGVLAIARVDYGGFEPVQRLVAGAIVDGAPVDPLMAMRIARLPATDCRIARRDLGRLAARRSDRRGRVRRSAGDRSRRAGALRARGRAARAVRGRQGAGAAGARSRRSTTSCARPRPDATRSVGASSRERVDAEILRLAERSETLQLQIDALESRDDEVYRRWRDEYNARRYQAPTVTRLVEVTFRIAGAETRSSC